VSEAKPGGEASGSRAAEAAKVEYGGILLIHLLEGKDLEVADLISSDPFVVFTVGQQQVSSKVIPNTLNPKWEEKLELCVKGLDEILHFTVYDQDLTKNDFLGSGNVDLRMLKGKKDGECLDLWLTLSKVKTGWVHLMISFQTIAH